MLGQIRLPSWVSGGVYAAPTSPVAILPLTGSKPETSPPPPFRDDVGSRPRRAQKRPTIFGKRPHPPLQVVPNGATWTLWISTRGVEGLHKKSMTERDFSKSCANVGKKVRHCPKGVKHECSPLDPGTVSRKFCTPKGCTPKKVQNKEKIESQKLSLRPCNC